MLSPIRKLGALRTRATSINRVWVLNALILLGCVLLLAGPVGDYEAIAEPEIAWWLLAIAVAATERWPANLEFGAARTPSR